MIADAGSGGIAALNHRLIATTPTGVGMIADAGSALNHRLIATTPTGVGMRNTNMASTYLSLDYHLVFGTKNREPFMAPEWRSRLHEYLGGTISGLGGFPQGVGGVADHVHLLVGLKATHCLADFLRELKKSGSIWVHETIGMQEFAWQEGYAAFTVSATARPAVKGYIANQEEHHRVKTFHEELVEMLRKAEVEFDEKYLD